MNIEVVNMVFGSHLYGTDTPESDRDYKGIYIPPLNRVLLSGPVGHSSSSTGDPDGKNGSGDVDMEWFSLVKFVNMAVKGETCCIDMLHAPNSALKTNSFIWQDLKKNRNRFYSKNMKAFLGYVRRQASKYGQKGGRLDAIAQVRTLLNSKDPDTLLVDVSDLLPVNEYASFEESDGPNNTTQMMYVVGGKKYFLNTKIGLVAESINKMYEGYGHRAELARKNEGIDWKALSHALRACYQLRSIYTDGGFEYPLIEAPFLLEVKQGKHDYLWVVAPLLERLVEEVEQLADQTNYPEKCDKDFWDNWLVEIQREVYGIGYGVR